MKRLHYFGALALLAMTASCDKDNGGVIEPNNPDDVIVWEYSTAYKLNGNISSIKRMDGDDVIIEEFDKNGRLTHINEVYFDAVYSYNADGRLVKVVRTDYGGDGQSPQVENVSTTVYEYGNGDKCVPNMLDNDDFYMISEAGLIRGLSKISVTNTNTDRGIDEEAKLTFQPDGNLLVTIHYKFPWGDTYDNSWTMEYKDGMPYQAKDDGTFFGPVKYQSNGMFDSFECGIYDNNGEIYSKERHTYVKGVKFMLEEKSEGWGFVMDTSGESTFKQSYQWDYKYDKDFNKIEETGWGYDRGNKVDYHQTWAYDSHGNVVSRHSTGVDGIYGQPYDHTTTFTYTYDSKGNWTSFEEYEDGQLINSASRIIEYY